MASPLESLTSLLGQPQGHGLGPYSQQQAAFGQGPSAGAFNTQYYGTFTTGMTNTIFVRVALPPPAPTRPESDTAWLRRRVDEMCWRA